MMTIDGVRSRFGPDFVAARELVMEKFKEGFGAAVRAYRKEHGVSVAQAIEDLADGAEVIYDN